MVPGVKEALLVVAVRNKSGGQRDVSGQNSLEGMMALVTRFWQALPFHLATLGDRFWAMRLPVFREIVSSAEYAIFANKVQLKIPIF